MKIKPEANGKYDEDYATIHELISVDTKELVSLHT